MVSPPTKKMATTAKIEVPFVYKVRVIVAQMHLSIISVKDSLLLCKLQVFTNTVEYNNGTVNRITDNS
jgi:hypothetical protein